jgi:hypothetical protein
VAVRLARLTVYPSGVEVEVEVARRPGSPDQDIFGDLYQPIDRTGRVRPEILRIDVVFADGRRASSVAPYLDAQRPPDRPVLVPSSGGGSSGTYRQILWLWPLPPPGPLVVSCRWPAVGLESAQLDLDGTVIAAAAARAERLWDAGGAR